MESVAIGNANQPRNRGNFTALCLRCGNDFSRFSGSNKNPHKVSNFSVWIVVLSKEEGVMQYLLLIYDNEKRWTEGYGKAELEEYRTFGKDHSTAIKGGNALQPTSSAVTVRVRDGERLTTDGPFAETKEQLAGYYLVEASSRDEASAIAAKIPGARYGSVEVRPIMTFS
jgi:hypothetical protein